MAGILDYLTGNDAAASPWGMLYQQPQPKTFIDYSMGFPVETPASPFGDPSQSSVANPTAPPQAPMPATGFGAGASPFGFAGPGSMSGINPAMMAGAPQPAATQVAQAPQPPATDLSSVNRAPLPVARQAAPAPVDDGEEDAPAAPAGAPGAPPGARPSPAPFSLSGSGPGIGDRLGMAARGFMGNLGAGPIGALMAGTGSLLMGRESDPTAIARGNVNATGLALLKKGAPLEDVQAAVTNPTLMTSLLAQYYGKDKYKVQQTGENGLGGKTFKLFNEADGTFKDIPGNAGGGVGVDGLGDMSKTGSDYIASVPVAQRGTLKGMLDGTIQPPSSFAASKPYWQTMIAAAKHADPTFDENNWAARHKMSVDLASSGNSTMGGILSNGESSFKHLAEYTASAADQGNASHDFPLGGAIAHAQNYLGNSLGGSTTYGKVKAINDNLGHYGQESTKFYAGTGGGVEERMNALKEMNPVTTSSEEAAAYAAKEKSLMLDRLNTKFQEIRNTYGDADAQRIIAKHMPDIQANIAKIDANIARLRGQAAGAPGATGGTSVPPPGNYVWTPGGGLSGGK